MGRLKIYDLQYDGGVGTDYGLTFKAKCPNCGDTIYISLDWNGFDRNICCGVSWRLEISVTGTKIKRI